MLLFGSHHWRGESGKTYKFKIALLPRAEPKAGGGIYVFVRRRFIFFLEPLYIGKAARFQSRIKGHERWWEAYWHHGATERHFLSIGAERDRRRIEEDLIRRYKPKLNNVHVPRHAGDAPNHPALRRAWDLRQTVMGWLGGGKQSSKRLSRS